MRELAFAVHHDRSPLSKIHLSLGSRLDLHPHKWNRLGLAQMSHESFYGLIAAGESVLTNQVLINALSTQTDPTAASTWAGCGRQRLWRPAVDPAVEMAGFGRASR